MPLRKIPYSLSNLKETGFTLIETLLYFGILSLIIGALSNIGFLTTSALEKGNQKLGIEEEASSVTDRLNWLIAGSEVTSPQPGASATRLQLKDSRKDSVNIWTEGQHLYLSRNQSTPVMLTTNATVVKNFSVSQTAQWQLKLQFQLNEQDIVIHQQLWSP